MVKSKGEDLAPDLSPSSAEFSKLSKLSKKELGDARASSTPDEWDYENIDRAIKVFNKAYPGLITRMYNDVCTEMALTGISKHAILNEQSGFQKGFWLPSSPRKDGSFGLAEWMERAYPSLWREPKHARWFMRKFPQFSYEYAAKRMKV